MMFSQGLAIKFQEPFLVYGYDEKKKKKKKKNVSFRDTY